MPVTQLLCPSECTCKRCERGKRGKRGKPGPATIIPYAPTTGVVTGTTTYVGFGADDAAEETKCWAAPRSGTLLTLAVNVSSFTGGATSAVFTIRHAVGNGAFVATGLTLTFSGVGVANVSVPVAFAVGDRISLQAVIAGSDGGAVYFSAGLAVG